MYYHPQTANSPIEKMTPCGKEHNVTWTNQNHVCINGAGVYDVVMTNNVCENSKVQILQMNVHPVYNFGCVEHKRMC